MMCVRDRKKNCYITQRLLMLIESLKYSISISIKMHTNVAAYGIRQKCATHCCWFGMDKRVFHAIKSVYAFLCCQSTRHGCQRGHPQRQTALERTTGDDILRRRKKRIKMKSHSVKWQIHSDKLLMALILESFHFFLFVANTYARFGLRDGAAGTLDSTTCTLKTAKWTHKKSSEIMFCRLPAASFDCFGLRFVHLI